MCTKQVGTGEINQIIESLLKVKVQRITKTYLLSLSHEDFKDHPRWMFRKNLMEFFVGLLDYLYKFCCGYATTNP